MKTKPRVKWKEDELILAFYLYCKIPFGKIHIRNPEIIKLAKILGRTPSSVSWKLANFAHLDPSLIKRGIRGASHGSKSEAEIWNKFSNNWEELVLQSEYLYSKFTNNKIQDSLEIKDEYDSYMGIDKERLVKTRINQLFFRNAVLASYNFKCAVTGIDIPELLNASHIIPWSKNEKLRLNPRNGICLNTLHDRAFDRGLISINKNYELILSSKLENKSYTTDFFKIFQNKAIELPDKFLPDKSYLKYHYDNIFQG
jgi:putative restriction endonuclease